MQNEVKVSLRDRIIKKAPTVVSKRRQRTKEENLLRLAKVSEAQTAVKKMERKKDRLEER